MTVSAQTTFNAYTGNGVTTVFPYQFKILANTDLQVYVAGVLKTLNVDYSVSGVGADVGGSVTFLLGAPAAAASVSIVRAMTVKRTTDYQQLGDFLTPVVNPDFDNAVLLIQDVVTQLGRSVRTPADEVGTLPTLPSITARAGKYIAFDALGQPIGSAGTGTDNTLRTDLATGTSGADGSRLTNYRRTDAGSVARTLFQKLAEIRSVMDFGCVADGVTDNSVTMRTIGNALGGFFIVPAGVNYTRKTLLTGLDPDVVFLDISLLSSCTDPGQTVKRIAIISNDTSVNDTALALESGHHVGLTGNNFGTAGTASATNRVFSRDWMCGEFLKAGSSKKLERFAAGDQYQKHPSGNFWAWFMNSYAPWLALADEYEYWTTLEVISGAGKYRVFGSNVYVSTGAGTTGASPPVHLTGSVSDGGVTWTWVDTVGRTIMVVDEYARILVGSNSVGAQFDQTVTPTDPGGGDYGMNLRALGVSKKALFKLFATTAGGASSPQPFLQAQDGVGTRVMRSGGAGSVHRFTDVGQLIEDAVSASVVNVASGDTTPSVLGSKLFHLVNAGATNITALDDGVDGQEVEFFASNGNTTFVSSATLLLQGSINITLTAWSSIKFRKVPNAISNRWIEVSRSIK